MAVLSTQLHATGKCHVLIAFNDRPSDSPFVERVWGSHSERAGTFYSIAACHWEMVVSRYDGKTSLTIRGPETRATMADCPAYGEWFAIRFRLGTFMPLLRPESISDRKSVTLPSQSGRSFFLNGAAWEYPDFENAETFVSRLVRAGLIWVDHSVLEMLDSQPQERSLRTTQRHILQATGLTYSTIRQIERARRATNLLREGASILDAMYKAGYYDQAHLTRSLKRFIGQTPAQILRAEQQLSFLYKTR
jgi:hypothetical protein